MQISSVCVLQLTSHYHSYTWILNIICEYINMKQEFHWNAPKIFFAVHVILYAPKTIFFQHTQFVSNCEPCEMYTSLLFLYTSATWKAYICLHIDIFKHIFHLGMFTIDSRWSDMAWQMSSLLPGEGISLTCSKNSFFCSRLHVLLYSPKTFFQHCQFCRNGEPSEIYISLSFLYKFASTEAFICLHFDIYMHFLSGNAWNR